MAGDRVTITCGSVRRTIALANDNRLHVPTVASFLSLDPASLLINEELYSWDQINGLTHQSFEAGATLEITGKPLEGE